MCIHSAAIILFAVCVHTTKINANVLGGDLHYCEFQGGYSSDSLGVDPYRERVKHTRRKTHYFSNFVPATTPRNQDTQLLTLQSPEMTICTPTRALVGVHEIVEFHILRVGTGKTKNNDIFKVLKHSHFRVMCVHNVLL